MSIKDAILFGALTVGTLSLFGVAIALSYWDAHEARVMQFNAYQKNLECRVAMKNDRLDRIADVCGPIPLSGARAND